VSRADRPQDAGDDRLDAFAGRAAHQLGEAIALLRGHLVALEQRHDPALEEALGGLRASADRTQRFSDDLLDLVAAGRELDPTRRRAVALGDALDAARERLGGDLQSSRATLRAGTLPAVDGDPDLVERLLAHAVRAALAAGGRRIEVRGSREGELVELEVSDDGTPPEDGAFAPFARPRGRGTLVGAGVSLTICGRIAERHGGTIDCSVADGRTLLRCTLPAADEAVAAARPPARPDTEAPLRVLLSDDVAELRTLLRRRLEAEGDMVVVGEAGDGASTLLLAAEMQPEVVVLDLELCDMPPGELLAAMRTAAPGAAIVTYSGHEPAAVAGAAARWIDLHVPKTTDLGAVGRAVREIGRRTRDAA
jgi:CheY-like chemotaxis protein